MKAGRTEVEVNTLVRITKVSGNDPEDQSLVGVTGRITHPFPGKMSPGVTYIAGIWTEAKFVRNHGTHVNLCEGDEFEVVTQEYDVDVCRIGYANLTLRVSATSEQEARQLAEDQAGNHSFTENRSEYESQGATLVESD